MDKINLEDIWVKSVEKFINTDGSTIWDIGKDAMLEACKQVLELAAENAEVEFSETQEWSEFHQTYTYPLSDRVNKQSILDTINQIK